MNKFAALATAIESLRGLQIDPESAAESIRTLEAMLEAQRWADLLQGKPKFVSATSPDARHAPKGE